MKMKLKALLSLMVAVVMLLSACTAPPETSDQDLENGNGSVETANFDGAVTFGVCAPMTGNNTLVGSYITNGAKLAQKMINESGGILGKELQLVFEDEVDNIQASVNAMTKLVTNPDVVAFYGSNYSAYDIAVSPTVLEYEKPMMAGGSSANIAKENNPYIWMCRLSDDKSGLLLAKAATENLGLEDPAIVHLNESFGIGLMNATVESLKDLGVTVDPDKIYSFNTDEQQFSPIITQVMNSGADGLIAINHQATAPIFLMQVQAAGFNLPCLGSSSFTGPIIMETVPDAAEGWYAITDWLSAVDTEAGKTFADGYRNEYGNDPDMPAASCYDSIMLLAEACRIAGTTEDSIAINNALGEIRAYEGAMSVYTPDENRVFCTSNFLAYNTGGKATLSEIVFVREP